MLESALNHVRYQTLVSLACESIIDGCLKYGIKQKSVVQKFDDVAPASKLKYRIRYEVEKFSNF